jgi:signal transduction histidine kinase
LGERRSIALGATPPEGQFDALRREITELRASRERLAMSNDAERRSLERALHDGVQQLLVGLAANLEIAAGSIDADPAAAKRLLEETGRDAQLALDETRRLAHMIYPPLLEAGGLGVALRSAAASANVPVRIDVATDATYPPEIAGAVYFCCLALLEGVEAGTPVAIRVSDEAGTLTFAIEAEGDVDADRLPIRDRVEALGGRLTIEGSGDHTRAVGSLPLPGGG